MEASAYPQLESIFARVGHLNAAERTLSWERRTLMPPGGMQSRTKVLSTLRTVAKETICSPRVRDLLDAAEADERAKLTPWQAANLREMRRVWRHATAVPISLQSTIAEIEGPTEAAWESARRNNDFQGFVAPLTSLLNLQIEALKIKAEAFSLAPYDTLLEEYEPGLRQAVLEPLLDDLAGFLPGLVREVSQKQRTAPDPTPLSGPFQQDQQYNLSKTLATLIGFDFNHGRLDTTAHPFTSSGVPGDVRITTRFHPDEVRENIIATIHETGHALYEAGLPADWAFQPVALPRGYAIHESQSLLFEMQASRSSEFIPHLARLLRETFGRRDSAFTDENVSRSYRRVVPGFIRVQADEVTYPLHIILRYRLERGLLDGSLRVAEIPAAWNAMSQELLGILPPTDSLGCLQDAHWAIGYFGYFPVYTLGALIAAQLFATAQRDEPTLLADLGRADFSTLLRWTRQHVHRFGSFYSTGEQVIRQATGETLSTKAFKKHLVTRYLGV
jgi:carboxypeptidase Taq